VRPAVELYAAVPGGVWPDVLRRVSNRRENRDEAGDASRGDGGLRGKVPGAEPRRLLRREHLLTRRLQRGVRSRRHGGDGRGFHSLTSQLNLSRFRQCKQHPTCHIWGLGFSITPEKCSLEAENWRSVSALGEGDHEHVPVVKRRVRCDAGLAAVEGHERVTEGRAVQVDPIRPTLKAPGSNLLELQSDALLSSFAFNLNLRRYMQVGRAGVFKVAYSNEDRALKDLKAGAYTRPLFSST